MKKLALFAGIPAIALTAALSYVHAQTAPPAVNWTGFYVGGNLGGGWTSVSQTQNTFGNYFANSSVTSINRTARNQNLSGSGVIGGGQIGYNLQLSNLVLGIEGDLNWLNTKKSATSNATYPCCAPTGYTLRQSAGIDGLGTLRGRVGVAVGNTMIFATGGLSYADTSFSRSFSDNYQPIPPQKASASSTRTGWNAGGGVEYAINNSWSVKAEYLYHDLGSMTKYSSRSIGNTTIGMSGSADFQLQTARLGVNYRF